MRYLFGDSTPSPLTSNFIEFLRDALDFSVHVLLADERVAQCLARSDAHRRAADDEVARLRSLDAAVLRCLEETPKGEPDSPTSHCAAAIARTATETVRAQESVVRSDLLGRVAKVEMQEATERDGCLKALETLLLRHDPPAARTTLRLVQQGASYAATLDGTTPYGLEWSVAIEIPPPHLFGHVVRVDKIVPHLGVHAPESAGWIRKEVKLRPQHLEKYYVTELTVTETGSSVSLRANADGSGAGFDMVVGPDAPRVGFVRVGEPDDAAAAPFDLSDEDAEKILVFHEKLVAACADLSRARKALSAAKLEGVKFQEHPQLSAVVGLLVGAMSPITQEIARHSLTPTELVLKRLVTGDRREEIFVSKASLIEKLLPLSVPMRERFQTLGLGVPVAPRSAPPPPPPSAPSAFSAPPPGPFAPSPSVRPSPPSMRASSPSMSPTPTLASYPPPPNSQPAPPPRTSVPAPPASQPSSRTSVPAPPPSQPPPPSSRATSVPSPPASQPAPPSSEPAPSPRGSFPSDDSMPSIEISASEPVMMIDEPKVIIDDGGSAPDA